MRHFISFLFLSIVIVGCGMERHDFDFEIRTAGRIEARGGERITLEVDSPELLQKITATSSHGEARPLVIERDFNRVSFVLPEDIGEFPIVFQSAKSSRNVEFKRKWFHHIEHPHPWKSVAGGNGYYCALDETNTTYCFSPSLGDSLRFPTVSYLGPYSLGLTRIGKAGGTKSLGQSSAALLLDQDGHIGAVEAPGDYFAYISPDVIRTYDDPSWHGVDGDLSAGCAQDATNALTCWNIFFAHGWPWAVTEVGRFDSVMTATAYSTYRVSKQYVCLLDAGKELRCQIDPNDELFVSFDDWIDVDLEYDGEGIALRSDGLVIDIRGLMESAGMLSQLNDKRPGFESVRGSIEKYCGAAKGSLYCTGIYDPGATEDKLGQIPSLVQKVSAYSVDNGSVCAISAEDGSLWCWGGDFAFDRSSLERIHGY